MIGTIFLWLYWPSFNGIFANKFPNGYIDIDSTAQSRAFLNTILSLCSCTIITLAMTIIINKGRIDMVHIQNSTLAGKYI